MNYTDARSKIQFVANNYCKRHNHLAARAKNKPLMFVCVVDLSHREITR
jgi:hypothetical protein